MSKIIKSILEQLTTKLTNNLISNLNISSSCVGGVCYYYTACQYANCNVAHCKYSLLTGVEECSPVKPPATIKIKAVRSKIQVERIIEESKTSDNKEDNEIQIINKILNK